MTLYDPSLAIRARDEEIETLKRIVAEDRRIFEKIRTTLYPLTDTFEEALDCSIMARDSVYRIEKDTYS